ncbi:MAG: hypothetical protein ACKPI9_23885 [Dolichospermum sp.]
MYLLALVSEKVSVAISFPVVKSQILIVLSQEPEITVFPSVTDE